MLRERRPDRAIETNVEFWAAVILDFAGVPAPMMPAMFTCARTAGWSAHILEQKRLGRIVRPSALYDGHAAARPGGGRRLRIARARRLTPLLPLRPASTLLQPAPRASLRGVAPGDAAAEPTRPSSGAAGLDAAPGGGLVARLGPSDRGLRPGAADRARWQDWPAWRSPAAPRRTTPSWPMWPAWSCPPRSARRRPVRVRPVEGAAGGAGRAGRPRAPR